jgi:uncharacterized protein
VVEPRADALLTSRPLSLPKPWLRGFAGWLLACCTAAAFAQAPLAIPALDSPVVDTTGTLSAADRRQLEQQALALQQRKGSQLQVLMVPSTQPETIEQYAVRAFEQWKLGRQGVDDAVLLVVAKDDRRVRFEVGYGLEGALPDITAGRLIQEYLVPKFREGDYAGGIRDATAQVVRLVEGEPLPAPMADHRPAREGAGGNWWVALFVAYIVASLARSMFRGLPSGVRGLVAAAGGGGVAWLLSSLLLVGGLGAAIGFFVGLMGVQRGRYARQHDWGGFGGWGGGMGGGGWGGGGLGGGGGWSGGGGMSGGGGASGSW